MTPKRSPSRVRASTSSGNVAPMAVEGTASTMNATTNRSRLRSAPGSMPDAAVATTAPTRGNTTVASTPAMATATSSAA
ncbi:MAG: hypothetical protein QM736_23015 [Vicinamibacterales bacterium]